LESVEDIFLGTRLAFEILRGSPAPWMAYYERLGDNYIACSTYGVNGSLPSLNTKTLHEAFANGYIQFQDEKSLVFQMLDGHVLILPEASPIPTSVYDELHRVGSISIFSNGRFRLYPQDSIKVDSVRELLQLGSSRNFSYGSFFLLNTDVLTSTATALCPHAVPALIGNELRSVILSILGSSGHALGLKNNSCLCVFYSHAVIDTELVVTQVIRTLLRSVSAKDPETLLAGPFFSTRLSNERATAELSTFIDSVVTRLQR